MTALASDLHESTVPVVLEVSGAHKRFGEVQALDGAGISLRRGEWLALLGPNGAGKTTLIRSITGRVRLDSGDIRINGRDLGKSDGALRRKIGIVSQEIALYPTLTATENLQVWGELHGISREELRDRIKWALGWTELEARSGDLVKGYSGGMKRRLNIACSLLHDPEILILDEPTVGVDPQSRERIWDMLRELRQRRLAILWATHQLDEAQHLSDRIVIIDYGRVIENGTFDELVHRTVGPGRLVTLLLDSVPSGLREHPGVELTGGATARCRLENVAEELSRLLATIAASGARILELTIEPPSLQEVFLHLTGRELRE
jgi:ABC-2 type transport system ATP-binding protein